MVSFSIFGLLFTVSSVIISENCSSLDNNFQNSLVNLDRDLLKGIDNPQFLQATQELMTGLNNDVVDKHWITDSLGSDNSGGFVLKSILFILSVIIGSGFGIG